MYLLTCKSCSFQYVGETVQKLRDRVSGHRASVNHDSSCFRVKEHFSGSGCSSGFYINIIEKLPGNGRTDEVKGKTFQIDPVMTATR